MINLEFNPRFAESEALNEIKAGNQSVIAPANL